MVAPKKHFGQHFLTDKRTAEKISNILSELGLSFDSILEIGPGKGVMTDFLFKKYGTALNLCEIDIDLIANLKLSYPDIAQQVHNIDFLEFDLSKIFTNQFAIIGNFPYNISSQIVFKVIDYRANIPEFGGMFQKEVAQRICEKPGSKIYGLLSAWVQCFYDVKYLFTVNEGSFFPPPKVKSGVMKMIRKENFQLGVDENLLLKVIKSSFGQRRKTLRNSLSQFKEGLINISDEMLSLRPEQLSSSDFIYITRMIEESML